MEGIIHGGAYFQNFTLYGYEARQISLLYDSLCFVFIDFSELTVHNFQLLTSENVALIYSVTIFENKTKDCAQSWSFQHKLQHCYFYLQFDVYCLS